MPSRRLPQWNVIPRSTRVEQTARWAANAVKDIYSMLNVEVKRHDIHVANYNPTTTAAFYELTEIMAGITGSTSASGTLDVGYREGDKIRLKSIHIKGHVEKNASATDISNVQLLLIKHYDNKLGRALSYDEIYDSSTGSSFYTRLRNLDHTGQYKILKSKSIEVLPTLVDKQNHTNFSMYIDYKRRRSGTHVEWTGTNGSDPSNGKYYLCIIADSDSLTPNVAFSARMSYVDN